MRIRIEFFGKDVPDYFPYPTVYGELNFSDDGDYEEPTYDHTFWGVGKFMREALEDGFNIMYQSYDLPNSKVFRDFLNFIKLQYGFTSETPLDGDFHYFFRFSVFDVSQKGLIIEAKPYGSSFKATFWN